MAGDSGGIEVSPARLRHAAVRLRDTADESRRNVATFLGTQEGAPLPGLRCTASYSRLAVEVYTATEARGAKLAVAADTLENNAEAYAHGEEANRKLFPAG